ncbi:uncharacterized protein H6S33_012205 [Morchella sextelata]|uniref:uncharacterized protein n=1 Tax=Morchella sextelata TaxID=1174677 RepID=UPI001D057FAC|nr:uncharacterized protein H6S33_012205 [Morchella sextelata]KAH0610678.1 hypothetical protein H6S33_012205 [Morchella sextelata]
MSSSMEVTLAYDYSTGDFLAFVTLVHKLYWLFYKVAKDAPEDFKKLVRDIGALFECISTLDEEATKPGSPLGRAKQERVRAVKNLISRGEVTLERLQTWAEKHETLREISRPKMKQWYDKARWAYNIPELDAMRKQVLGHVGFMRLFLNSLGKQYRENSSFDEVFAKSVMGAAFKNNEKVLQRHWAAIAADKWNEAATGDKWWASPPLTAPTVRGSASYTIESAAAAAATSSGTPLEARNGSMLLQRPQLQIVDASKMRDYVTAAKWNETNSL